MFIDFPALRCPRGDKPLRGENLTFWTSAHQSWNGLSSLGELIEPASTTREGFLDECRSGKLDGVLVCFRTFNSISITGLFDDELVQALPSSLKFVCHNGEYRDFAALNRGVRKELGTKQET